MHDNTGSRRTTGQIACAQTRRALPWYVNGTLADAERIRLLQHLEACAACTAEHAAELRLLAALRTPAEFTAPSAEAGWRALEQQLDKPVIAPRRNPTRWLAFAVAAQAVAIVLLTALLFVQHEARRTVYATVAEPQAEGSIRMALDEARRADAAALARGVGAHLAQEAGADGVFTLIVDPLPADAAPARSLQQSIEWLRRQPGVLLAEPVGPAADAP